ncbi:MAG: AAA family ATPase [Egibacteraceae bacterium]
MIDSIRIQGYRSVRLVRLRLDPVTVVAGKNGTGKTNLYRALRLFQHAAAGTLARAITGEGGMESVLWAGDEKKGAKRRVAIEAHLDDFAYTLELGLPPADETSAFDLDPEVKLERISVQGSTIAERKGDSATVRDSEGRAVTFPFALWSGESMLSQIADPERFPALPALRDHFLGWRFYHHFPTDADAPARRAMVRVRTPVLAADGHDLASALRTIVEIGDTERLVAAVDRAFPGCRLHLDGSTIALTTPGLRRPLAAPELSDGTFRYLYLLAALLTPRPPGLLAFNEPETSLHPDLLRPLAELVAAVPQPCQVWLTTHALPLAEAAATLAGIAPIHLDRQDGTTVVRGQGLLDRL